MSRPPTAPAPPSSPARSAVRRPSCFSGAVLGRYIVEGSNDGGTSWDILVDDDGQQALFTSQAPGVRNFDCVVALVRVRSVGNAGLGRAAYHLARRAARRRAIELRRPRRARELRLRRAVRPRPLRRRLQDLHPARRDPGRLPLLDSRLDGRPELSGGLAVHEPTSRAPGRPRSSAGSCRSGATPAGPAPVIAFGSEGILEAAAGAGTSEISIADDGEVETGSTSNEEVLRQYQVPLALLSSANLRATLAGQSRGGEGARKVTYRVRAGGTADQPDGTVLLSLEDDGPGDVTVDADSAPFARPSDPSTLIKVTGQGDGTTAAVLRNFTLVFHP